MPRPTSQVQREFSRIARERFSSLDREGSELVATGEWLEALIEADGIHPEVARRQLDAASEAGLLRRSTEGFYNTTPLQGPLRARAPDPVWTAGSGAGVSLPRRLFDTRKSKRKSAHRGSNIMSLRDRIRTAPKEGAAERLYRQLGIASNPFPGVESNVRQPSPRDCC